MSKSQSNAFNSIRDKIQKNMKEQNVTYQDIVDSITKDAEILTGENNMIEIDPNNPSHREWFEEFKK